MNNNYKAQIELVDNLTDHINIIAGCMYSVNLSLTNIGESTWTAFDKNNTVTVGYRIKNGERVLYEGVRTKLPYNLSPGENVIVRANFVVPQFIVKSTEIEISWDLVHEGVSWFEDYGSSILKTKLSVCKDRKNLKIDKTNDDDIAIQCINLSKKYKLYSNSFQKIKDILYTGNRVGHKEYWALKDINLRILKGETYGIIGFNGSGKSTLLSILAQTKQQSHGSFIVNGKIAALLELGAGFHGELTGRENVILNSHLHGISRRNLNKKMELIEDFAGIGDFFDKPVKSYSSGMFVRLAFSLAINVDPDILIIDEALAVGDEIFQRKCYKKLEQFKAEGKTIIFVSHDLNAVRTLCTKVALIYDGNLIYEGTPNDVVNFYQKMTLMANLDQTGNAQNEKAKEIRYGNGKALISTFKLYNENNEVSTVFKTSKEMKIYFEVDVKDYIEEPVLGILIKTINGVELFGSNSKILGCKIDPVKCGDKLKYEFKFPMHLNEGTYFLSLGITDQSNGESITVDRLVDVTFFRVVSSTSCLGLVNLNTGAEIIGHVE